MEMESETKEPLSTRVTKINNRWHCRLYRLDEVHDEMACTDQRDIGYCMREMLRWYDKMSFEPFSDMAIASRNRGKNFKVHGKVFFRKDLENE